MIPALPQEEAPWFELERLDFLNWCEQYVKESNRPVIYPSKSEALLAQKNSRNFEQTEEPSKFLEKAQSSQVADGAGVSGGEIEKTMRSRPEDVSFPASDPR